MNKQFTLFGIILLLVMAAVVACSEEPVTVEDQMLTREAQATEFAVTREAEIEEQQGLLARIAPEGTDVMDSPPGNQHDNSVVYAFEDHPLPPAGGVHNGTWQKCGTYSEPVKPEHAIHSMEHGGVWITYQPDLDEDMIKDIEKLGRRQPYALISPYPNLQSPLVLTAWGLQLELDGPDDPRAQQFIDAYAGGQQSPEPGASCTTGTTDTVEDEG